MPGLVFGVDFEVTSSLGAPYFEVRVVYSDLVDTAEGNGSLVSGKPEVGLTALDWTSLDNSVAWCKCSIVDLSGSFIAFQLNRQLFRNATDGDTVEPSYPEGVDFRRQGLVFVEGDHLLNSII